jgi:hypothetical protein
LQARCLRGCLARHLLLVLLLPLLVLLLLCCCDVALPL